MQNNAGLQLIQNDIPYVIGEFVFKIFVYFMSIHDHVCFCQKELGTSRLNIEGYFLLEY